MKFENAQAMVICLNNMMNFGNASPINCFDDISPVLKNDEEKHLFYLDDYLNARETTKEDKRRYTKIASIETELNIPVTIFDSGFFTQLVERFANYCNDEEGIRINRFTTYITNGVKWLSVHMAYTDKIPIAEMKNFVHDMIKLANYEYN